jgi:hypothetical protein
MTSTSSPCVRDEARVGAAVAEGGVGWSWTLLLPESDHLCVALLWPASVVPAGHGAPLTARIAGTLYFPYFC